MTWFGKCDFMSMKQKLEDISKTKLEVAILQKEYNCYVAQAEKMKELGLFATSEKCSKGAEEIYQEIQKELSEYKRLIAAVKSVEGLQGMILQLHYFEGKSISHISEMMNYSFSYIQEMKNSAVKAVEKAYQRMEGVSFEKI